MNEYYDEVDQDILKQEYLETVYSRLNAPDWVYELWEDLYENGLVKFEDYLYDGNEWYREPQATLEIGEDGVWFDVQAYEVYPGLESELSDYLKDHPEYGLYGHGKTLTIKDNRKMVSETTSIVGKGTIQYDDDIVGVYKPNGECEYMGVWEDCPYYRDELEYHSYNHTYICYNPDDEADENDEYRIIVLVGEA